jgi:DNA-directed RNA polymerase subunit RPC12/RpoP
MPRGRPVSEEEASSQIRGELRCILSYREQSATWIAACTQCSNWSRMGANCVDLLRPTKRHVWEFHPVGLRGRPSSALDAYGAGPSKATPDLGRSRSRDLDINPIGLAGPSRNRSDSYHRQMDSPVAAVDHGQGDDIISSPHASTGGYGRIGGMGIADDPSPWGQPRSPTPVEGSSTGDGSSVASGDKAGSLDQGSGGENSPGTSCATEDDDDSLKCDSTGNSGMSSPARSDAGNCKRGTSAWYYRNRLLPVVPGHDRTGLHYAYKVAEMRRNGCSAKSCNKAARLLNDAFSGCQGSKQHSVFMPRSLHDVRSVLQATPAKEYLFYWCPTCGHRYTDQQHARPLTVGVLACPECGTSARQVCCFSQESSHPTLFVREPESLMRYVMVFT